MIADGGEILPKLSKQTRWLIEQGIEEWGPEVGDVFGVLVEPSDWDKERGLFIRTAVLVLDDFGRYEFIALVEKEKIDK